MSLNFIHTMTFRSVGERNAYVARNVLNSFQRERLVGAKHRFSKIYVYSCDHRGHMKFPTVREPMSCLEMMAFGKMY